jgi:nitrogen-specific signal transduction histidine kinase
MEPRENSPSKGQTTKDILTAQDLESLVNPLSVVRGYTQLLQRRIRQGHVIDGDELLRTLGLIEEASRVIQMRLDALSHTSDPDGAGSKPD